MSFDVAQVFSIDPNLVGSAAEVGITEVDLYFQALPNANNNASGIQAPGVTVYILPTANGVPVLDNIDTAQWARVGYYNVTPSANASLSTAFQFYPPVQVQTGIPYCFLIVFDGDEDFVLWNNVVGDPLVGSTTDSTGTSGPGVGALYDYISPVPLAAPNASNTALTSSGNSSSNSAVANSAYTGANWNPISSTTLKFDLSIARYSYGGNTALAGLVNTSFFANTAVISSWTSSTNATTGDITFNIPAARYEYVTYNEVYSSNYQVTAGERLFQNTVFWPGGVPVANSATVSLTAGSNLVSAVSNNINWPQILTVGGLDPVYLVFTGLNQNGANDNQVAVRQVTNILSNTTIQVDEPLSFSNAGAYFFQSPIALADQFTAGKIFGLQDNLLIMVGSTSNTSIRFVNDSVIGLSVNVAGNGYSNSDVVSIGGFESVAGKVLGGYPATANIVTFANGGVSAIYLSNLGCGFINNGSNAVVTVANSTGHNSTGTGLTLNLNVGSIIVAEFLGQNGAGGQFQNCVPVNIEIGSEIPNIILNNPSGTAWSAQHRLPYYSVDDAATFIGKTYYCDSDGNWDQVGISNASPVQCWEFAKRRCVMSWSKELVTPYANGSSCAGAGGSTVGNGASVTSNSSVIVLDVASNGDFSAVSLIPQATTMTFSRYIVNDDYTAENTNYGNAWAKGLEVKINLANGSLAEDCIIWTDVFRPHNSDVLAFVKIHHSQDPESFDDKDWTMLQLTSGSNVYSTATDLSSLVQLTFSFQPYPNNSILAGQATSVLSNNTLTGQGTTWQTNATANLVAGDLIVFFPTLFPNNYQVAEVTAVANDTSITLNRPVSNNGLVGPGLSVGLINFPKQAFHNVLNDNVVRYYSSTKVEYDGFDTYQVKLVMISANGLSVPMIADVRAVAASS